MSERITVTVINEKDSGKEKPLRLVQQKGHILLNTLREGRVNLPSLCGVTGKCGRCTVRFLEGAPLPTQPERGLIAPERLRQGYRLACTARPVRDCVIETDFQEEQRFTVVTETMAGKEELPDLTGMARGDRKTAVAVDLGTTTVAMQLIHAGSGCVLDTVTCLNPQRSYGADVISRIHAGNEGRAEAMRTAVREVLSEGIGRLCDFARENELCKPELIVIAANTVMGHLFMGYSVAGLGKSPFTPVNIGPAEDLLCGIKTVLLPGISAFVGGDIVSGIYACGLCNIGLHNSSLHNVKTWLFVDLGTNAEMVIGRGNRLFCTAAAAGPAFEGSGTGARKDSGGFGRAKEGTGAERILALAKLLKQGAMDSTGLLREPYFSEGICVEGISVTQKDIRELQAAKAAVRTGIHFLKEKAGISHYGEIDRVYLAGGFGFYLDKRAAVRIGLIPEELEDKLITAGNTSLLGAARYAAYAVSGGKGAHTEELTALAAQAEAFNMAQLPDFEKIYVEYMDFNDNKLSCET